MFEQIMDIWNHPNGKGLIFYWIMMIGFWVLYSLLNKLNRKEEE